MVWSTRESTWPKGHSWPSSKLSYRKQRLRTLSLRLMCSKSSVTPLSSSTLMPFNWTIAFIWCFNIWKVDPWARLCKRPHFKKNLSKSISNRFSKDWSISISIMLPTEILRVPTYSWLKKARLKSPILELRFRLMTPRRHCRQQELPTGWLLKP